METTHTHQAYADRKVWFSMWFLGAIVTFGVAFFPMFYRLIEGRNRHLAHEAELEEQVAAHLKQRGKEQPATSLRFKPMNSKAWAASIILIIPAFIIMYQLIQRLGDPRTRRRRFFGFCSAPAGFHAPDHTANNISIDNNCDVGGRRRVLAIQSREPV